jgi:hypothetical protein
MNKKEMKTYINFICAYEELQRRYEWTKEYLKTNDHSHIPWEQKKREKRNIKWRISKEIS